MRLNSRNTIPPGGWIYDQKADDDRTVLKKFSSMNPISDIADEVLNFRKGNNLKRATKSEVLDDIDEAQCLRLGFDPAWCRSEKKTPLLYRITASASHVLQGASRAVGNIVTGAQILTDWLGDGGKPVSQELAQQRANICVLCEKNQEGHGAAKLTASVANAILVQRRKKLEMKLTVEGEDNLHTCTGCDCHLPLKVWTPIETIAARTSKETLFELPSFCWQKNEIAQLTP